MVFLFRATQASFQLLSGTHILGFPFPSPFYLFPEEAGDQAGWRPSLPADSLLSRFFLEH